MPAVMIRLPAELRPGRGDGRRRAGPGFRRQCPSTPNPSSAAGTPARRSGALARSRRVRQVLAATNAPPLPVRPGCTGRVARCSRQGRTRRPPPRVSCRSHRPPTRRHPPREETRTAPSPRGHGHARALRSVADRLLNVACTMLRDRACFRFAPCRERSYMSRSSKPQLLASGPGARAGWVRCGPGLPSLLERFSATTERLRMFIEPENSRTHSSPRLRPPPPISPRRQPS